jgi:multiple sugar transport system permease protein
MSLLIASFVVLFPIYTVFVGAFKTRTEYYAARFTLPDNFFNFDNFMLVFERGKLGLGFWNIGVILVLSIVGNIIMGTMTAYALGRFEFKLKRLIMGMYLVAAVIPLVTTQVATFGIIKALGLYNTLGAPIVLYLGADVIQIVIYLQFVNSIPKAIDESAFLEGASLFRVYWQMIFPLLAPATATVIILKFITIYNDFYIPFLYMPSQDLRVVSTAIYAFVGPNAARMEVISAFILVVFVPTAVLFLFLQRYVFSGVTSGAVKQ